MKKKFIGGIFLLLCSIGIIISAPARADHTNAPRMMCKDRAYVLETFKKEFNEIPVEQGVEASGVLFLILANKNRNWTMFFTKLDNPYIYCSLMSGTNWSQNEGSSTGILPNGSVIAIGYVDNGDWSLVILNVATGLPKQITTGTGWEQLINLNIQTNSL